MPYRYRIPLAQPCGLGSISGGRRFRARTRSEHITRTFCGQASLIRSPSRSKVIEGIGAPDRIRTCDLCLRRATLYPTELRVLGSREPRPNAPNCNAAAIEPNIRSQKPEINTRWVAMFAPRRIRYLELPFSRKFSMVRRPAQRRLSWWHWCMGRIGVLPRPRAVAVTTAVLCTWLIHRDWTFASGRARPLIFNPSFTPRFRRSACR